MMSVGLFFCIKLGAKPGTVSVVCVVIPTTIIFLWSSWAAQRDTSNPEPATSQLSIPATDLPANAIAIEFRVTMGDYREAQRTLASIKWPDQPSRTKAGRGIWGWVLFVALLFMFAWLEGVSGLWEWQDTAKQHPAIAAAIVTFFAMVLLFWIFALIVIRRSITSASGQVIFSSFGMEQRQADSTTRTAWHAFDSWSESENLIVLGLRKLPGANRRGMYFPKRLFQGDHRLEEFRALLSKSIQAA